MTFIQALCGGTWSTFGPLGFLLIGIMILGMLIFLEGLNKDN
jgi:hypothetical protein